MTVEGAPATSADPPSDTDLLTSKFAPSSPAVGITERPRLLEAVASASQKRLTLVNAPVGYGKTTVLADWYRRQRGADEIVAWLSLERAENDPALFWRYVVGALRWSGFEGGANAEAILRVPGADVGAAIRSLLNDLAAADKRIALILDDYHVVEEPACHELVAYLLEHRYIAVERGALRLLLNEDGPLSDLLLSTFISRREALQSVQGIGLEIVGPHGSEPTMRMLEFARANRLPYTWEEPPRPAAARCRSCGCPAEESCTVQQPARCCALSGSGSSSHLARRSTC